MFDTLTFPLLYVIWQDPLTCAHVSCTGPRTQRKWRSRRAVIPPGGTSATLTSTGFATQRFPNNRITRIQNVFISREVSRIHSSSLQTKFFNYKFCKLTFWILSKFLQQIFFYRQQSKSTKSFLALSWFFLIWKM